MKDKKIVLVDALAIAYKAYFAMISRPLRNKKGENTSAVYGFVNQILKIINDTKPDFIGIAFDSKEKTFRHEIYDKYKSSRAQMPEDMIPQMQFIKDFTEAMNIPILIKPGYEADDIIGTVAKKAENFEMICYAVTPDKDYLQLITDKINIIKPGKSADELSVYNRQKVIEEFGFDPIHIIDYLALCGDNSDDIPGVAGVGPKTAIPLIQQFGSIESIYENIDKIKKESLKQKLIQSKENAFLSKKLATIDLNVPLDYDFFKLEYEKPDMNKIQDLFEYLDFKSLFIKLKTLSDNFFIPDKTNADFIPTKENIISTIENNKPNYILVTENKDAELLAKKLLNADEFVFDTETNSLNPFELKIAGVSFSIKPNEAYFVAVNPFYESNNLFNPDLSSRISINDFVKIFSPVFSKSRIKKICQNGKFDISVMHSLGIEVENFHFDTMLASYIIDPDQKHNMDDLAIKYLNYKPIPLSDLYDVKKEPDKIFEIDLLKLSNYSCEDADVTFRLYQILKKLLRENNLEKIAYEIEFPLVEVLERMENNGVRIDSAFLNSLSKEMELQLNELTKKIYECAQEEFNINSTKQLQEILFNKLKLSPIKSTKTGFSTDAKSLESLRGQNEIIEFLLLYRQLTKLKSTYTDALPKLINRKTNKIHTSYNQTIASTGRLSSVEPNLQNIPIRTEMGKEIRKAFIPTDSNYIIMSADYSQIELRIMASLSEDENLKKAFLGGEDIHRSTAAKVFQVSSEEVTPEMRRKAKEVNFGILYGIGVFGLKTRLGISQSHAKEIIDTYFNTFKNVKKFMDDSIKFAREKGYAQTLLGRRRYLPNINSKNNVLRQFEERVAINMPIQGTAADMIKLAMINIHKELKNRKLKSKMILQVHDELVFDVKKSELETMKAIVKNNMENALKLNVPVTVEIGIGENWLEAH